MVVSGTPSCRIRVVRDAPEDRRGDFVLYWMTAAQRQLVGEGAQPDLFTTSSTREDRG